MDRCHKILLNVVVIVLIFAPLFFVLRHREWLSLYMNALSLFIILYMCWGFFRIACARIAATDQPWKKGAARVLVSGDGGAALGQSPAGFLHRLELVCSHWRFCRRRAYRWS